MPDDSDYDHSDHEEDLLDADEPPTSIDPYAVLGIDRTATADQVRSAYRKTALRCHPDKVAADKRDDAHVRFQEVAFAYAVLSDAARRKRYDETGSTAESVVDSEGFSWSEFYRSAFADAVNADAIDAFSQKYKHSDEEHADVVQAYARYKGNMDGVYESVMLSNVLEDDARFRKMIDDAIAAGDVKAFPRYTNETDASKRKRMTQASSESVEAEEYAIELGVHDKLFGGGRGKNKGKGKDKGPKMIKGAAAADEETTAAGKSKKKRKGRGGQGKGKNKVEDDQAGLAELIRGRQQDRAASFLDNLAAKYGATEPKKGKGGKKRQAQDDEAEEEPSEEAFQAAAARLSGKKARR